MPYGDNKSTTWDKSKLPSRHVTVGPERAPHRSYYYAMGLTEDEIAQPFVGVATCWNEAAPCNIALTRQAQAVKGRQGRAARRASSPPSPSPTASPWATGHEVLAGLPRRDRRFGRADDARPLLRRAGRPRRLRQVAARHDDGDAAPQRAQRVHVWRLHPARQVQGPGRDRSDVFEAVGQHAAGNMTDEDLHELECVACPSAGACGGQFTANTMACVSEAIGLALPGSAGAPAPYESRDAYAVASGRAVMELIKRNIRPRDIVTRKALENACVVVAATGGSTNAGLHLPAIAHECGIDFTWTTSPRSCSARPTSPTSSPAGTTSPTTCTRPAASR